MVKLENAEKEPEQWLVSILHAVMIRDFFPW
jgi:hypothetical protein